MSGVIIKKGGADYTIKIKFVRESECSLCSVPCKDTKFSCIVFTLHYGDEDKSKQETLTLCRRCYDLLRRIFEVMTKGDWEIEEW